MLAGEARQKHLVNKIGQQVHRECGPFGCVLHRAARWRIPTYACTVQYASVH
jgi:hypothetical protein